MRRASSARKSEGFPEQKRRYAGAAEPSRVRWGRTIIGLRCLPDGGEVSAASYRRRYRPQPTEVAVAFPSSRCCSTTGRTGGVRRTRGLIFEDLMAAARAMATIAGQRQLDAGSRLLKSAASAQGSEKSAVKGVRAQRRREEESEKGAFDSDEDEDGPTQFTELPQDIMDLVFELYAWDLARAALSPRSWRVTARRTLGAREQTGLPEPERVEVGALRRSPPCAIGGHTRTGRAEGFEFDCLVGDKRSRLESAAESFSRRSPSGEDGVPTPRMRRISK